MGSKTTKANTCRSIKMTNKNNNITNGKLALETNLWNQNRTNYGTMHHQD